MLHCYVYSTINKSSMSMSMNKIVSWSNVLGTSKSNCASFCLFSWRRLKAGFLMMRLIRFKKSHNTRLSARNLETPILISCLIDMSGDFSIVELYHCSRNAQ